MCRGVLEDESRGIIGICRGIKRRRSRADGLGPLGSLSGSILTLQTNPVILTLSIGGGGGGAGVFKISCGGHVLNICMRGFVLQWNEPKHGALHGFALAMKSSFLAGIAEKKRRRPNIKT